MKRILFLLILFSNITYSQVINKPQHEPPETINAYAAVLAFDICSNTITVDDAASFGVGDTILMIQMKGAIMDTSNTPAFGTILDYGNAGNYEFNFIGAKSGNTLTFLNKLTRSYDIPDGVVQLVRVPKYKSVNFIGGLTPLAWDGATGGIVCVYATLSVTSVEDIFVSGRGFRGAQGYNATTAAGSCAQNNYFYPASSQFAAYRGESIGSISSNIIKGKGSYGGGGGGGNSHNAGGGGGGNGGSGGFGGYQSDSCASAAFDNRGIGGKSLQYNSTVNKIFMGSGGGAGHIDNADVFAPPGGAGGGIIIIITPDLDMLGERIHANGADGRNCVSSNCNDGNSGGGAGGTILLSVVNVLTPVDVESIGGNGAQMIGPILPGGRVGPGGGGGGGVLFSTGAALPVNINYIADGGAGGVILDDGNNPWGATAGDAGITVFDLQLPFDTVMFTPNIDSVRIDTTVNYCNNISFEGFGYTNTYPVASWQWYFGDGSTANTQNAVHDYGAVGVYNVKLVITDVNGCKDSISTVINSAGTMQAEAGADTALCASGFVSITLNGSGTGSYSWSPAAYLNNSSIQNPVATIDTTRKFYLSMSNGTGCSAVDSVTITINKNPLVKTLSDTSICMNSSLVLTTNGAVSYNWSPGIYVNDSTLASPQFIDSVSRTLIVNGTGANGCKASDTININVKTPVSFIAPQSKTICKGQSVQLNGNNGNGFQYFWSPALYLNNAYIINPIANPPATIKYIVTITDNACNYDSSFTVDVNVLPLPFVNATKSNDINCNKPFTQLNVGGAVSYSWVPAATLSNAGISNPVANPVITTKYKVTVSDNAGCTNTDSVTVLVNFGDGGILLPNSFTPNNDGINDCFGIRYYRNVQDLVFIIYNRYGTKVFETNNAAICWDGKYKGQKADPGGYVYYLSAKTLCGSVVKRGSVLLMH